MSSATNTTSVIINPAVDCSLLMIVAWNRFRIPDLNENVDEICEKICFHLLAEQVIWIISATNLLICPMEIALEAILLPDNGEETCYATLWVMGNFILECVVK